MNEVKRRVSLMDKTVSTNLRLERMKKGYTQNDLANYVDVTIQQIQKYENGKNRVSSGKLHSFSTMLDVPLDSFFTKPSVEIEEVFTKSKKIPIHVKVASKVEITPISEGELTSLLRAYNKIDSATKRKKALEIITSVIKSIA